MVNNVRFTILFSTLDQLRLVSMMTSLIPPDNCNGSPFAHFFRCIRCQAFNARICIQLRFLLKGNEVRIKVGHVGLLCIRERCDIVVNWVISPVIHHLVIVMMKKAFLHSRT